MRPSLEKPSMPTHEHFKELCTRAIASDLSDQERSELKGHLLACLECRAAYADFSVIASNCLAVGAPAKTYSRTSAEWNALRARTLAGVHQEGLRLSEDAQRGRVSVAARMSQTWRELRWNALHLAPRAMVTMA